MEYIALLIWKHILHKNHQFSKYQVDNPIMYRGLLLNVISFGNVFFWRVCLLDKVAKFSSCEQTYKSSIRILSKKEENISKQK